MNFYFFLIGFLIVVLIFLDFFYTTLSGNGSGILTKQFNNLLSKIILALNWKWLRKISGFLHVVGTFNLWLVSLILGCFLIFNSSEQLVVNATTNEPASFWNRFYYTCYVLSTVGIGDYKPATNFGQIITGLLSFTGFILLTTALAYVISVTGAVGDKRNLAVSISAMGKNPKALYAYFTYEEKYKLLFGALPDIQKQLYNFTHNYLSFPMIENYLTEKKTNAETVQLVNMHEVLRIIFCQAEQNEKVKLLPIINALGYFMTIHMKNEKRNTNFDEVEINKLRVHYWTAILEEDSKVNGKIINVATIQLEDIKLENVDSLLACSGWKWTDIYDFDDEKSRLYN